MCSIQTCVFLDIITRVVAQVYGWSFMVYMQSSHPLRKKELWQTNLLKVEGQFFPLDPR